MDLLSKRDLVLGWLYVHSGENPSFISIRAALPKEDIDDGEILDCLLHLHRDKYIYCEVNGNRDCIYTDRADAHYLINFSSLFLFDNHQLIQP